MKEFCISKEKRNADRRVTICINRMGVSVVTLKIYRVNVDKVVNHKAIGLYGQ